MHACNPTNTCQLCNTTAHQKEPLNHPASSSSKSPAGIAILCYEML